jgi:hypothetical protein
MEKLNQAIKPKEDGLISLIRSRTLGQILGRGGGADL